MKYVNTLSLLTGLVISAASLATPTSGQSFLVEGRCVTVTEVAGGQASYEWREGNTRGRGSMPIAWLGKRCDGASGQASRAPATPSQRDTQREAGVARTSASATGFAKQTLDAHNRYRCMHAVPPLQWSDEIANYAQRWIEKAGFKHSDSYRAPLGPMGENLYWSSQTPSGVDAVGSWYAESRGYDYARPGPPETGHFTAMIWKGARYVGCARVAGTVSCNYAAATTTMDCNVPNMAGCYVEQVRPRAKGAEQCN